MTGSTGQGAALIWCPFPDRESARTIAAQLLDERLVACANIVGEIESLFVWQGKRGSSTEMAVLFKTSAARLGEAAERLGKLHPYDTPAILGWHADAAAPATLDWLASATGPDT